MCPRPLVPGVGLELRLGVLKQPEGGRGSVLDESMRALVSHVEGLGFESQSSQANDLQNCYGFLPSLVLGITRSGKGLVSTVSILCE